MIGQKIGSYLIESELGAGAMGVVYKAVHVEKNREVALKTISKEAIARGGKTVERFFREIKLLEQFRHPNIVRYLGEGRYQGINYLVMEYISGTTLENVIKNDGPLDWVTAVRYAAQLCSALDYAHSHSVVHRDLKPSNLMINDQGKLKLTDFGIAKDLEGTQLTAPGRTLGTAAYMAPEQIAGNAEVGHKTDLYALGIVMYEMLTGETPFKGETIALLMHMHITEPPPRPSKQVAVIPVELDNLIVELLSKKPSERPFDAAAVQMKLDNLLERVRTGQKIPMVWPEEGSPETMPTRAHMQPRSDKSKKKTTAGTIDGSRLRGRLEVAGLLAALGILGGLIGYFLWPPSENYLFAQAEKLMASDQRADWMRAQSDFLDPLDQRFPNHARKKQTDAWRDRLGLAHAENRAELLRTAKNDVEEVYLASRKAVEEALKRGEDTEALKQWRDLETKLSARPHPDRGWGLLAGKRAAELEKTMAERRAALTKILERAEDLDRQELHEQAATLRSKAVSEYGTYSDLIDLVSKAKSLLPEKKP